MRSWFISEIESLKEPLSFSSPHLYLQRDGNEMFNTLQPPFPCKRGLLLTAVMTNKAKVHARSFGFQSKQVSSATTAAAALQASAEQRANTKVLLNTCCSSVQLTGNNINNKQRLGCVKTHTRTHVHTKTLLIRAVFRFINEMWRRLMRLAPVNSHIKPREAGPRCEPIAASSATIGSPHPCSPFNFHFSSTRKKKKKEEGKKR